MYSDNLLHTFTFHELFFFKKFIYFFVILEGGGGSTFDVASIHHL